VIATQEVVNHTDLYLKEGWPPLLKDYFDPKLSYNPRATGTN